MNAKDKLAARREAVDRELERLLDRGDSPLFQSIRYVVLSGGKRFRPLLLLAAGEWFKVARSVLLPFACALEFIHNYSLIHDDLPCMDDDDVRRGRPSCHKAFGEDIALLAGEAPLPADLEPQRAPVIREIALQSGARGMIEGQCLDIRLSPETLDETSYRDLILKKTAGLIIASVKSGGLLGQASEGELQALVDYGTSVGLAFQVRDDILDAAQEQARPELFRPNSVVLFGEEGARRRLEGFVTAAQAALDRASIASEELRTLASKLLVMKEGTDR